MKKFFKFLLIVMVLLAVVCVFDMYFNDSKLRNALNLGGDTSPSSNPSQSDASQNKDSQGGSTNANDSSLHYHEYGAWEVMQQASCDQDGIEERYCSCGEKQTRTLSATEHNYGEWRVAAASTCGQEGVEERYCSCGAKESRAIAALSHKEGSRTIVKQASCEEDGVAEIACVHCNTVLKTEPVSASGHSYRSSTVAATCGTPGGIQYTCSKCDDTYLEKTSEPTNEHKLSDEGICTRCSQDFRVDMTTRIGPPTENTNYGFVYDWITLNASFSLCAEAKNLTNKTIKYYSYQLILYNTVGDPIYSKTKKITGPIKPGEILNLKFRDGQEILSGALWGETVIEVKIANIKLEYTDGTVEYGAYNYSTTNKVDGLRWLSGW